MHEIESHGRLKKALKHALKGTETVPVWMISSLIALIVGASIGFEFEQNQKFSLEMYI